MTEERVQLAGRSGTSPPALQHVQRLLVIHRSPGAALGGDTEAAVVVTGRTGCGVSVP